MTTSSPAPARTAHSDAAAIPNRLYTRRAATLAGIVLILGAALLYALTLDRWVTWGNLAGGDLVTHQYAQVQARPGNAPGYPLYTMGGWLWFHALRSILRALGQPYPNPIPILSSYSTLWALTALWFLYRTLSFLSGTRYTQRSPWGRAGNWPVAFGISSFYAVTYFFWFYATTTEQYSSAVAQTLAIVYVYLLWAEADEATPAAYGPRSRAGRLLILLALLCGMALAHMLTVAFIVPPLVAVVLWQRPALLRRGPLVAAVVVAAMLPLTAYAYVYIRGAQHPEWWGGTGWASTAAWFWAFVSTSQGREELGWGFEAGRAFLGNGFPQIIWQELSLPVLVAGLLGIALYKRRTVALLYGTLAIYLVFAWAYRYGNWFQVILPAYPLVLLGIGALPGRLAQWPRAARHRALQPVLLVLLTAAILWRFAASWPQADSSRRPPDEALARAASLLAADLPQNAALYAEQGEAASLDYLAHIWDLRPDLRVVGSSAAQEALAAGRPLLATWGSAGTLIAEMDAPASVQAHNGDWARINGPQRDTAPQAAAPTGALPVLDTYAATPSPDGTPVAATAPSLDLRLRWLLPAGGWPAGVAVSMRPTRGDAFIADPAGEGGAILQVDAAAPLHGFAALAPAGPVLEDAYRLPLAAPLPDGADGLAVILYRAEDGGFVTLADLRLPLQP